MPSPALTHMLLVACKQGRGMLLLRPTTQGAEGMIRSAASKVMWVGRATVFLVGLAVILALLFGVASTALGKNGQALILGKGDNVATKVTGLIGKVATGSALVVKNPSGGSALELRVGDPAAAPSTKTTAPMKVDSEAKVANLNADELDGEDSEAFQQRVSGDCAPGSSIQAIAQDGTVACQDADHQIVQASTAFDNDGFKVRSVSCPVGSKVLGGGARYSTSATLVTAGNTDDIAITVSAPQGDSGWTVIADRIGGLDTTFSWRLITYAVCAKV